MCKNVATGISFLTLGSKLRLSGFSVHYKMLQTKQADTFLHPQSPTQTWSPTESIKSQFQHRSNQSIAVLFPSLGVKKNLPFDATLLYQWGRKLPLCPSTLVTREQQDSLQKDIFLPALPLITSRYHFKWDDSNFLLLRPDGIGAGRWIETLAGQPTSVCLHQIQSKGKTSDIRETGEQSPQDLTAPQSSPVKGSLSSQLFDVRYVSKIAIMTLLLSVHRKKLKVSSFVFPFSQIVTSGYPT